jgi:hypothetical protein
MNGILTWVDGNKAKFVAAAVAVCGALQASGIAIPEGVWQGIAAASILAGSREWKKIVNGGVQPAPDDGTPMPAQCLTELVARLGQMKCPLKPPDQAASRSPRPV